MPFSLEQAARDVLHKAATEIVSLIRQEIAASISPAPPQIRALQKARSSRKRARKLVVLRVAVAALEREHIQLALDQNHHSVIRAARALGMPVTTLKYKLKKYRIR